MYYTDDTTAEDTAFEYEDQSFNLENFVIEKDEVERARAALLKLPEPMQDAVNLVCICGYTSIEAARVLKIKPGAVRARVFQARKKLRQLMAESADL